MNLAKTGWSIVLGVGLCLSLSTSFTVAQERYLVEDKNGNYHIEGGRGPLPYEWEVVDPDPNGLNCRLADRLSDRGSDFYNNPVSKTFFSGELFWGPMIVLDDRGLPWIWVGTSIGRYHCLVRANSQYVRPVRRLRQGCIDQGNC